LKKPTWKARNHVSSINAAAIAAPHNAILAAAFSEAG